MTSCFIYTDPRKCFYLDDFGFLIDGPYGDKGRFWRFHGFGSHGNPVWTPFTNRRSLLWFPISRERAEQILQYHRRETCCCAS